MKLVTNINTRIESYKALDSKDKKTYWKELLLNNAMYILLIIAILYTFSQNPKFLAPRSIVNIISLSAANLPIACGIAGCIVLTGTDLSAGRVVGLTACISASLLQAVDYASKMFPNIPPLPIPVVILTVLLVGAIVGWVNGFFVAKFQLHPFIVTLATQLIVYGILLVYIMANGNNGQPLSGLDDSFKNFVTGSICKIGDVPIPNYVWFGLIVVVIMWFIWNKTTFGKNLYAVGGNPEAAASADADASAGLPEIPEGASSVWPQEETLPAPAAGGEPPAPVDPPSGEEEEPEEERPMTLLEHLGELRKRLVRGFLAILIGFFACYGFAQQLFYYLSLPLLKVMPADSKFIYTGVAEGFFVDMKVAFVAGVFVACPFLFYQIWAFIAPGLYEEEKKYIIPLALSSALFFILGGVFCYFGVFPFAFEFFMSYSTDNIVAMLSIDEYLSFALKMVLAFGLIFEMPLFSFFLARMGLITAQKMREVRKYAILAIFVVAAILTPPDVFSQLMMAGPMIVLYEVSIWVAVLVGKKKAEREKAAEEGGA